MKTVKTITNTVYCPSGKTWSEKFSNLSKELKDDNLIARLIISDEKYVNDPNAFISMLRDLSKKHIVILTELRKDNITKYFVKSKYCDRNVKFSLTVEVKSNPDNASDVAYNLEAYHTIEDTDESIKTVERIEHKVKPKMCTDAISPSLYDKNSWRSGFSALLTALPKHLLTEMIWKDKELYLSSRSYFYEKMKEEYEHNHSVSFRRDEIPLSSDWTKVRYTIASFGNEKGYLSIVIEEMYFRMEPNRIFYDFSAYFTHEE